MINWLRTKLRNKRLASQYPDVHLGERVSIDASQFGPHVRIGADALVLRTIIGRYSYFGPRCILADAEIGQFCSIAADVAIGSGSHPIDRNVAIHPMFYLHRPPDWTLVDADTFTEFRKTVIGNDVWIGTKAVLRDGVSVGDGAVIGAGAIVTRDLEPYGVYAGVPAKLLRYRFDAPMRQRLLALAWWNKDMDWIRANAAAFADVEQLFAVADET